VGGGPVSPGTDPVALVLAVFAGFCGVVFVCVAAGVLVREARRGRADRREALRVTAARPRPLPIRRSPMQGETEWRPEWRWPDRP
jgi:hypothetical protein